MQAAHSAARWTFFFLSIVTLGFTWFSWFPFESPMQRHVYAKQSSPIVRVGQGCLYFSTLFFTVSVFFFFFFLLWRYYYRGVFPVAMPLHVVARVSSLDRTTCKTTFHILSRNKYIFFSLFSGHAFIPPKPNPPSVRLPAFYLWEEKDERSVDRTGYVLDTGSRGCTDLWSRTLRNFERCIDRCVLTQSNPGERRCLVTIYRARDPHDCASRYAARCNRESLLSKHGAKSGHCAWMSTDKARFPPHRETGERKKLARGRRLKFTRPSNPVIESSFRAIPTVNQSSRTR